MKITKVAYGEHRRVQNPNNQYDATQIRIDLEATLDGEETFSAALSELQRVVNVKLLEKESEVLDRFNGIVREVKSQETTPVTNTPTATTPQAETEEELTDDEAIVANLNWDDDFLV